MSCYWAVSVFEFRRTKKCFFSTAHLEAVVGFHGSKNAENVKRYEKWPQTFSEHFHLASDAFSLPGAWRFIDRSSELLRQFYAPELRGTSANNRILQTQTGIFSSKPPTTS